LLQLNKKSTNTYNQVQDLKRENTALREQNGVMDHELRALRQEMDSIKALLARLGL